MIKLIADSGSTKTDWQLVSASATPVVFQTAGINPYYQSPDGIEAMLVRELMPQLPALDQQVVAIHYYGAGCSNPEKSGIVQQILQKLFPQATVDVQHDLLAAARALCGKQAGIACILGTGSNACLYNGTEIIANIPNLGFILGDEGSGAYMGKKLLQDFLHHEMPTHLQQAFDEQFKPDRDTVVDAIHNKPYPNRYAASFSRFLADKRHELYCQDLIAGSFSVFLDKYVSKYDGSETLPVHFVGSIAYHYADILAKVLEKKKLRMGQVLQTPIEGLLAFHK